MEMLEINELRRAISLIKHGDRVKGKKTLLAILERDPQNETAWLWLATCMKQPEEKQACLQKALQINPLNRVAQQAYVKISQSNAA